MKDMNVQITTKTGNNYNFDHVIHIGYNFNHGTMINISIRTHDGSPFFRTFFKKDIENISVFIPKSNDDGNDQQSDRNEDENYISKESINEDEQRM